MTASVRGASTAGFTLLEALIATAMMGMILAALATITRQWLPNWNRGVARVHGNEQLARAMERVSDDLSMATFISSGHSDKRPFFDGLETSVTFVRPSLGPNSGVGLEFVRFAEVADEGGPLLVRTYSSFFPNSQRIPEMAVRVRADPAVLLKRPYRILFAYAGADRAWHTSWRSQPLLPEVVRLTIGNSSTAASFSTVVPIHARLSVDCMTAQNPNDCLASQVR